MKVELVFDEVASVYTPKRIAEITNKSLSTIYADIEKGKLKAQINKIVLGEDLVEYVKQTYYGSV